MNTTTQTSSPARLARDAAEKARQDKFDTAHRAYINSLTEEQGGEQRTAGR